MSLGYLLIPYLALGTPHELLKIILLVILFLGVYKSRRMWDIKPTCAIVREVIGYMPFGIKLG